jgi:ethanolamine ammonia-lyase large subunit
MFTAIAISLLVGAILGVVFHKYVVSEAAAVKAHVTAEVSAVKNGTAAEFASLRSELKGAVEKFGQKI